MYVLLSGITYILPLGASIEQPPPLDTVPKFPNVYVLSVTGSRTKQLVLDNGVKYILPLGASTPP